MEAAPEDVKRFGEALERALDSQAMERQDLAEQIGVSKQMVSDYVAGKNEPARAKVFAMEESLGLKPGTLSRLLGYLPVSARPTRSVPEAIDADPQLQERDRRFLRAVYREGCLGAWRPISSRAHSRASSRSHLLRRVKVLESSQMSWRPRWRVMGRKRGVIVVPSAEWLGTPLADEDNATWQSELTAPPAPRVEPEPAEESTPA